MPTKMVFMFQGCLGTLKSFCKKFTGVAGCRGGVVVACKLTRGMANATMIDQAIICVLVWQFCDACKGDSTRSSPLHKNRLATSCLKNVILQAVLAPPSWFKIVSLLRSSFEVV